MRALLMTIAAAAIGLTAFGTADAAMMHSKMHHKSKCTGVFMYMDMKDHKCKDATQ